MWRWINDLIGAPAAPKEQVVTPTPPTIMAPPSPLEIRTGAIPTSAPLLTLLSKFLLPRDPAEIAFPYWDRVLCDPVGVTLQQCRGAGWIVDASWEGAFGLRFGVEDLKAMLRDRKLRVSGNKTTLIERLTEADPEGMRALVADQISWTLAEDIRPAVQAFKDQERQRKIDMHKAVYAELRNWHIRNAIRLVIDFERTAVFPRLLITDSGDRIVIEQLTFQASTILNAMPGLLRNVPAEELSILRPIAALMALTDETKAAKWVPNDFTGTSRFDAETIIRMLQFHAANRDHLEHLRTRRERQLGIMTAPNSCPACKALAGQMFSVDTPPELPHVDCTHPQGCHCLYQATFSHQMKHQTAQAHD